MHVGMISGTYPPLHCGIGDQAAFLTGAMVRRGMTADVASLRTPRLDAERARRDGVGLHPILTGNALADSVRLARWVRGGGFDVLHFQYATWTYRRSLTVPFLPAVLRFQVGRIPMVVTVHDVASAHPLNRLRIPPVVWSADRVIVTNEEDAQCLAARLPRQRRKLRVVPIGNNVPVAPIGDGRRTALRQAMDVGPEEFLLAYFGILVPHKRVEAVLEATRLLAAEGRPMKLVLMTDFGHGDKAYCRHLQALIEADPDLKRSVRVTGHLSEEEVSHHFQAADAAALLFHDGVSPRRSSLLAAIAHGLPTVSSLGTSPAPGFRDGENILLVPLGRPEALADALRRLAENPALRRDLGAQARRLAERHDWDAVVQQTLDVYHDARSERSPALR